jgi:hypothetical protein
MVFQNKKSPRSVLIVEDEKISAKYLAGSVKSLGYEVTGIRKGMRPEVPLERRGRTRLPIEFHCPLEGRRWYDPVSISVSGREGP